MHVSIPFKLRAWNTSLPLDIICRNTCLFLVIHTASISVYSCTYSYNILVLSEYSLPNHAPKTHRFFLLGMQKLTTMTPARNGNESKVNTTFIPDLIISSVDQQHSETLASCRPLNPDFANSVISLTGTDNP